MIKRLLERLGIIRTPVHTLTEYQVTVFVMSEGTAQGIPRPLQVFKFQQSFHLDEKHTYALAPRYRMASEVRSLLRSGYQHELADGTVVTYAPNTIYKIATKEVKDD